MSMFKIGERVRVKMASVGLQNQLPKATIIHVFKNSDSYKVESEFGGIINVPESRLLKEEDRK